MTFLAVLCNVVASPRNTALLAFGVRGNVFAAFGVRGIFWCVSCCLASWTLAGLGISVYDALVTALRNNDKTMKTSRNADNKKDDNRHKTVCNNHNKNNNNENKVNNSDNNDNDNTFTKNDNKPRLAIWSWSCRTRISRQCWCNFPLCYARRVVVITVSISAILEGS